MTTPGETSIANRSNDDIYLLSSFGFSFRLNQTLTDGERFADPGNISSGLVSYCGQDPAYHNRLSRTAVLLDSLADFCVHRLGEVYAVGLVVPGSSAGSTTVLLSSAIGKPSDDSTSCLTLVVVANAGFPRETEVFLRRLLKELRALARKLLPPKRPSGADPDGRSPPPPVEGALLCG
jgi:hypothetical protein